MKQFSEATRVQMPAMVHLTRIGYTASANNLPKYHISNK